MVFARHQVGGDFGVGFGREFDAGRDEFCLKFGKVLDDAVVNQRELSAIGEVRVGVDVVGCAVRRPPSMPDSGVSIVERIGDQFIA
jgi:hypothetical protein